MPTNNQSTIVRSLELAMKALEEYRCNLMDEMSQLASERDQSSLELPARADEIGSLEVEHKKTGTAISDLNGMIGHYKFVTQQS